MRDVVLFGGMCCVCLVWLFFVCVVDCQCVRCMFCLLVCVLLVLLCVCVCVFCCVLLLFVCVLFDVRIDHVMMACVAVFFCVCVMLFCLG